MTVSFCFLSVLLHPPEMSHIWVKPQLGFSVPGSKQRSNGEEKGWRIEWGEEERGDTGR